MVLPEAIKQRLSSEQVYGIIIGSDVCHVAKGLLSDPNIRLLIIDDFLPSDISMTVAVAEEYYQKLHFELEDHKSRVNIRRTDPIDEAEVITTVPDFVFIHRTHELDGMIDAWLPRIKSGGWLGGISGSRFAIDEYVIDHPSDIEEDLGPSWYVWKGTPSIAGWAWDKAKTATKGAISLTKVAAGREPVSLPVLRARQEICNQCEFKTKALGGLTVKCQKCGCVLPAKQRLKNESCPIGSWDGIENKS